MCLLQGSCVCQNCRLCLVHDSLHLYSPVLHQQLWQHRSHHWTVIHTLQEWSELSGPVNISCIIQNNKTVRHVLFTLSVSIVKCFFFLTDHWQRQVKKRVAPPLLPQVVAPLTDRTWTPLPGRSRYSSPGGPPAAEVLP